MKTISNNDQIYIGKKAGAGLGLLNIIRSAKKSLKIVSPYLSQSYLKDLVGLAKKGVKITLITADELQQGMGGFSDFKQSDIIKQRKIQDNEAIDKKRRIKRISFTGLLISLFFILGSILLPLLIIPTVIVILISLFGLMSSYFIKEYNYEYYSIFRLKIFDSSSGEKPRSKELIHSKIFIIDENLAFLGSANFTYSGFNTHYETLIKIEDKKAVEDISDEVEKLYNSTDLLSKSTDELGREIYE